MFSPVAKLNIVRVLLSSITNLDWKLQQLNVKNTFLYGELEEEVHMELSSGFYEIKINGKVCKPKKSFYELKQSSQAWFGRFTKAIHHQRYKQA